jgi:geranylgeranyl reductase family protein
MPSTCDVLIVGAGPAGTAAATVLARSGLDVVLADQRTFPREKVCGDGLISDAIGALDTLGLHDRVLAEAEHVDELRVYAPSGEYASIRGRLACVPRERLDHLLLQGATDAGATFVAGAAAVAPLREGRAVTGVRFSSPGTGTDVSAAITLLATGANATLLDAFGLGVPMKSSGVAGRAYFEAPAGMLERYRHFTIAYDRDWCPGYGWIFPAPGNRFNIGVGLFRGASDTGRLRTFWEAFQASFAPAADIIAASRQLTPFKGAPLRTGLIGAQFGQPGLMVIGDAASMTYPGTGEGIGKAMESGLLAARYAIDALAGRRRIEDVYAEYGVEFKRRFASRYDAYAIAQRCAGLPWLIDLLARRANAGRFVRAELEALVDERGDASDLFSIRGLLTALVR